jgi:hypothetical protein
MSQLPDDIIRALEAWSQEHNLTDRAIESCKVAMQDCAREDAELFPDRNTGPELLAGYKLDEFQIHIDSQALIFKNDFLPYPYVDMRIGLYVPDPDGAHFRNLKPVGHYRLIVTLDGEINDDYLVIDEDVLDEDDEPREQAPPKP